jgi:hypothetical protein
MNKTLAAAIATFSLALAGTAAVSAQAANAGAVPAKPMTAPACVSYDDNDFVTHVHNNCDTPERIRVTIYLGPSSECHFMAAHTNWDYGYPFGNFDSIDVC